MNENTIINNNIIPIDQISSEQHIHIDNQQDQNSTQNDTNSKEIGNEIKQMKKSPMTPTPLYVPFFSLLIIIKIFY
jgi:GTP-dependent phosphoenolpyruvate carboxykinase